MKTVNISKSNKSEDNLKTQNKEVTKKNEETKNSINMKELGKLMFSEGVDKIYDYNFIVKNNSKLSSMLEIDKLLKMQKQFIKLRASDPFKKIGSERHYNDIIKVEKSLRYLNDFSKKSNAKDIINEIFRRYKLINANNLKIRNHSDDNLLKNFKNVSIFNAIPADICRLALSEKIGILPNTLQIIMGRSMLWGLQKAKTHSNPKSVNIDDNVIMNSINFRMLENERRRICQSRSIEMAYISKKYPNVIKLDNIEEQKKESLSKEVKTRTEHIKYLNNPNSTHDERLYEIVNWFYLEKLKHLDEKSNKLIKEHKKRMNQNRYGGIYNNPLFKKCIINSIKPEVINYINFLEKVSAKKANEYTNATIDSDKFVSTQLKTTNDILLPTLQKFAKATLSVVIEMGTGRGHYENRKHVDML